VDKRTEKDHQSRPRARPDAAAPPVEPIPSPVMIDEEDDCEQSDEEPGAPVYINDNPLAMHINAQPEADDEAKVEGPSAGVVVMAVLDWWTKHRSTETSAADVWAYTKSLCDGPGLPSFTAVKDMLEAHRLETTRKIHVCVNMCVAFYDPVSPVLKAHAFDTMDDGETERLHCPNCNEMRYLHDGKTPRRVVYYFPYRFWLQDLLAKTDLAVHSANDEDPTQFPSGHIRRSEGWRIKVTNNININSDRRNVALTGSCDGVPFFKDRNAMSGWPFVLTNENLPPGICRTTSHAHMVLLVPAMYKSDVPGGRVKINKKDPESLQPALLVLTDELLEGQNTGFAMTDYSIPEGVPGRLFNMKTIMLLWSGDYPGMCKTANMFEKGFRKCHWCRHRFEVHSTGHQVARDMRRHLPANHPIRSDLSYGPHAGPKPKMRTHIQTVREALEIEGMPEGPAKERKKKDAGIYGQCFFRFLALFDLIWDFLPDIMHIHKGLWNKWLLMLLKGVKTHARPAKPKSTHQVGGKSVEYSEEVMGVRMEKHLKALEAHEDVLKVFLTHS
jgi:hypothetical protein